MMRFLVIGLGSMGKRRIRCLKTLGYNEIAGYDPRADRRNEAGEKYGIKIYPAFSDAVKEFQPTVLIISVPPDKHHEYMKLALKNRLHFFVEASVVDTDMETLKRELKKTDIIAAPSATLLFHPAIQKIMAIVKEGTLGKISNIMFHSGQYLPDWHTYEKVSDYYVSNPATGGGREIVPFELSWFTNVFGFPKRVCGNFGKTITILGAETIDDTYNFLLDYQDFLATITVDVVSRHATRRLLINGDEKQLVWDWDLNCIKIYDPKTDEWLAIPYEMAGAEAGYNANIGENMYIEEVKCFIAAVEGKAPFINDMENDHRVLKLLYAIEKSSQRSRYEKFKS